MEYPSSIPFIYGLFYSVYIIPVSKPLFSRLFSTKDKQHKSLAFYSRMIDGVTDGLVN